LDSYIWDLAAFAQAKSPELYPSGIPWRQAFFRTLIWDNSMQEPDRKFFELAEIFLARMGEMALDIMTKNLNDNTVEKDYDTMDTDFIIAKILQDESLSRFARLFTCWTRIVPGIADIRTNETLLEAFCGHSRDPNRLVWKHSGVKEVSYGDRSTVEFVGQTAPIYGRSFFVTKRGYMGLGPSNIQKGDQVCIILGCPLPTVIRDEGESSTVLGSAYVYGMMQGEMMQEKKTGKFNLNTFIFR